MMIDPAVKRDALVIRGGMVVDGTGAPGRVADVVVVEGRIVAIDHHAEAPSGAVEIDADGLVVTPGFVDVHTHYDAQVFWDSSLSPSPLHGVTTVVGGNCGFSIAPLAAGDGPVDPDDAEYLMRMLARVEGMPLESLQKGVPWDWTSTASYLDRLEGTLMPNAGFLVGHSALRRVVMHDAAIEREATDAELAEMARLLRDGLAAGGLGFSSSRASSHNDHVGRAVPSRHASRDELVYLSKVAGEHPGTSLEIVPQVGEFTTETFELMADMSAAANRPLNWNLLQVHAKNWDLVQHQLSGYDTAEARGGRVMALTLPDTVRIRINLLTGFVFDILNGWDRLMALPVEEKVRQLRDPEARAEWNRLAQSTEGPMRAIANWAGYALLETFDPSTKAFEGRVVGDVARELGQDPWDTMIDIALADGLRTVFANQDTGQSDETWRRRVQVWRDHRAVVGASDAGAHLDMIDSFSFSTTLLAKAVREHELMPIEEAVHHLTDRPARLYGLRQRGRIAEGWAADLVVLDPATVGPAEVHTRFDLPGGAGRVFGGAHGIEHVIVNGAPVVRGEELLAARPGTVLRSGRDTETVTAR